MKTAFQLEGKIEVMEQGEGQSSGNEETPYTVVVQIPNPYGDSSGTAVCNYLSEHFKLVHTK